MFLAFLSAIATTLVLQTLSTAATLFLAAVDIVRHPSTAHWPRRALPPVGVVTRGVPAASPVPLTTVSFGVPVSWEILEGTADAEQPVRPSDAWIDDRTLALLDTLDSGGTAAPAFGPGPRSHG